MSTKDNLYQFLNPFLGKGLFTSSGTVSTAISSTVQILANSCNVLGAYHKNNRKMLQPLFSPKVLEGYSELFQKHATALVEKLKSCVDGLAFDVLVYLHDSAIESTMGKYYMHPAGIHKKIKPK